MLFGNYSSGSAGAAAFAYLPNNRTLSSNSGDVWINYTSGTNANPLLLNYGQQVLVQVVKEPGGSKGPRISSHVTLPGRLTVLLPKVRYTGVSRRIEEEEERARARDRYAQSRGLTRLLLRQRGEHRR